MTDLEKMIDRAEKNNACERHLNKVRQYATLEEVLLKCPRVAFYAHWYARNVIKGPWPGGEKAISEDGRYAYRYARNVIKGPWPEGDK